MTATTFVPGAEVLASKTKSIKSNTETEIAGSEGEQELSGSEDDDSDDEKWSDIDEVRKFLSMFWLKAYFIIAAYTWNLRFI